MRTVIYAYKTKNNNYEEVFENGICFFNTALDLNKSFVRITDGNNDDFLLGLKNGEVAYFITIPEKYLEVKESDDKRILPYPILFERAMTDPEEGVMDIFPVVVPCLISGMYDSKLDYIENPDYRINFDPRGLKFTKEQLSSIKCYMPKEVRETLVNRNNRDSLELFQEELSEEPKTVKDKEGNTRIIDWIWKPLMKQHKIESVTPPFAKKGNLLSIKFTDKKEKTKKLKQGKGKKGKKNNRSFDMEEDY